VMDYFFGINTTSVSDMNTHQDIIVYPNPSHSLINIASKENIQQIFVYDLNGRKVLSELCNKKVYSLEISSLTPGMYMIEIITSEKTLTSRIIVD
jgi:hypothetical protein